ncbi:G-type lectin S-receptor-like serine threonine-kinase At4g27290 isoform X1 [Olea europaea subsp. europaea]|uniref:Receptor-like serine/threonine-protein kinase n=1 Tax=Olea europaea subsp. europaea TaxID=158383 RepID=A0A8S0VAW5_OLEEU|nr:G-type lectin S-receptor-like serine threonine-kinase At4g27290 isoform X1 [Olea europaea subsp. europaea]
MEKSIKDISLLLLLTSILSILEISPAIDTISTTQSLKDGDTLVSSGGTFELGFFSPGDSKNRYVGIWYKKVPSITAVWVLNREIPLNSRSGILKFNELGHLVLVNDTNNLLWSSNTSRIARTPILQLLDSGNLVLREANDDNLENFLWQSFDYLSDTYLPGMNFGWNAATGVQNYLSSWTSNEDPAPGDLTFYLDPTGYPQVFIKRGTGAIYRMGPWNGLRFSGTPYVSPTFRHGIFKNKNTTYYREDSNDKSVISRVTLNQSGVVQRWVWVDRTRGWVLYLTVPKDDCDTYSDCGAYGTCYIGNSPACGCLSKFQPKDPEGWNKGDWSNGCIRRTPLNCQEGDVFLKYSSVKLPDAQYSTYNESMTLDESEVKCLQNCSCMAYSQLDISRGSGCLFWFRELIDIRDMSSDGQDIYIRMASSELDSKGKRNILVATLTSSIGVVLLGLSLMLYFWKRSKKKKNEPKGKIGTHSESHEKDLDLPLFDLYTISKATDNFSINNKLGEGGFGPVYKGMLEEGQDIAVKRLSKTSMQGLDEFKNEVICIAKLQHRNLVRLLGCCIQGEEIMLIYEYMPNKSLDLFLFDQTKSKLLDWEKRFQIVNGIARGIMYLHQDSRLRIIHRDLKASNILLDTDMNPKISDFGIARSFRGNETEDKTNRVVGTYGYMSPEYAVHGRYSIKSDVFSFGVLVLEIVSGKRNSGFSKGDQHLDLLGHAWTLYKDGRSLELVDAYICDSANLSEVQRLIHVGLLCVQQRPDDRPRMTTVVALLSNEGKLPKANQPGFFTEGDVFVDEGTTSTNEASSTNEITITQLEAR